MTKAEKLRFLADRAEDGSKFDVFYQGYEHASLYDLKSFINTHDYNEIESVVNFEVYMFTDVEKVILRNVDERYKYIARNEDGRLFVYESSPRAEEGAWKYGATFSGMTAFTDLFKTIQWEDEEPCEFRKYL